MRRYLLYLIEYFMLGGYLFYISNEMIIKAFSDRCNMTHKHYPKQPMHMCGIKFNMNFTKNPQLINSLDRSKNHPLIRKYSHIPFNNLQMYVLNNTDNVYNNITNCAKKINNDINIPTLLLTIPCGLSFLCLIFLWYIL